MASINWQSILDSSTVEEAIEKFYAIILKVIDSHAPYKWIKIKEKTAEWITNEFLSLIDTRNFRMKQYRKCRTELNWRLRAEAIRIVDLTKKQLKREYIESSLNANKNNPKRLGKP